MVCDTPFLIQHPNPALGQIPLPCGKCPPCKFRRVNSWVFRLVQEEKVSLSAKFVTLTYDTHSVPISGHGFMTLNPNDLRLYFKRLRKAVKQKYGHVGLIKYFAAGEYGTIGKRPHYHVILFNVPDEKLIVDCWSINGVPIGGVHIGTVTQDSIAYTMKYIDKSTWKSAHKRDDRVAEFQRSSKGIGLSYLDDPEVVRFHRSSPDHLFCSLYEGHRVAIPRYYKRRIFTEDEISQQIPHIQRVVADRERKLKIEHERTSSLDWDYVKEQRKYARYRSFYKQSIRDV